MIWEKATLAIRNLCNRALGVDVLYLRDGSDPLPLRGVFTANHVDISVGQGAMMSSSAPTLGVNLSDIPTTPKTGDKIQLGSTKYKIIQAQDDGEGGSLLILQKST